MCNQPLYKQAKHLQHLLLVNSMKKYYRIVLSATYIISLPTMVFIHKAQIEQSSLYTISAKYRYCGRDKHTALDLFKINYGLNNKTHTL